MLTCLATSVLKELASLMKLRLPSPFLMPVLWHRLKYRCISASVVTVVHMFTWLFCLRAPRCFLPELGEPTGKPSNIHSSLHMDVCSTHDLLPSCTAGSGVIVQGAQDDTCCRRCHIDWRGWPSFLLWRAQENGLTPLCSSCRIAFLSSLGMLICPEGDARDPLLTCSARVLKS